MTTQQLHDALSHLPEDLIAETDARRSAPPRVIPFRRYAAMAACFALVLACSLFSMKLLASGGVKEQAAAEVQMAGVVEEAEAPAAEYYSAAPAEEERGVVTENAPEDTPAENTKQSMDSAAGKTMEARSAQEDTPAEEAPREDTAAGAAPRYLETPRRQDTTACYTSDPRVSIIHSREELDEYVSYYAYQYNFDNIQPSCEEYDVSWFETQDLLMIAVHSVPVGSTCEVRSFTERDGIWEVSIAHDAFDPEVCTGITDWHILLTVEKNQIPDKDTVVLVFE